jgi:3-deoxy-7-phosphoheptulonate synthase
VVTIGRIAGQYAKPRSVEFMEVNGVKVHNYKGDNINSIDINDRNPS